MENKAEQYYPTYKSELRDVLLIEFEEAQKIANGQTKVYGQVTNILLAVATFAFTFLLDHEEKKTNIIITLLFSNSILFSIILFSFGAILLRYFVDLQKQITINARKVVTLRTMLGLDYGHIQLTLPNWRVEGATNPFVIKYFNGWLKFKTMPFWVITISINAIWWITTKDLPNLSFLFLTKYFELNWIIGNIIITISYLFVFRRNLNDRHETIYLNFIEIFCSIFRVKLIDNFEYIIYRAKLSYLELDRLKVNYDKLNKILVDIEDSDFYTNIGISFKSLIRGSLSRFMYFRKKMGYIQHGGSTITMQLARSLFIPSNQNKYLRKITEILLSIWLYNQFSKVEILKLYVASVRYERGVLGLSNSIKYFFGDLNAKTLSNEEAFFLVERLSNITSTVNFDRVSNLMKRTNIEIDGHKIKEIYNNQIKSGNLKK
jgi:penicillin-binding protein 1A